jgi:Spy/CpxP family protein refolding chaperone
MQSAERPGWQDPRILAMLFFVFLAGATVGALTMRYGLHEAMHPTHPRLSDAYPLSFERLRTELNLTPDQAEKLRSILDDFVAYHHDLEAQVESYRATGKNRILQILTPEQRTRFEKISSEMNQP